jgi:hypothetical protein
VLIVTGALRLSADKLALKLLLFDYTEDFKEEVPPHLLQWYFWGGTAGIAFLGPAYDFILQGSAYIILDILIVICTFW